MTPRRSLDPQFDLFVPYVADLPLRDQRETMERPFFSLAKRKRHKPIEYASPNGEVFVNVFPNPGIRHGDHLGRRYPDLGRLGDQRPAQAAARTTCRAPCRFIPTTC